MRVHYLQHVPFEGLGSIQWWLQSRSVQVTTTKLYEEPRFPSVLDFDWLVVMGGPMSAKDEGAYRWLAAEKRLIAEAITSSKVVLGICLGAQLIASSLGAKVYDNREREIGWFPIEWLQDVTPGTISSLFPRQLEVFHWHGETFELPPGADHLARSAACEHQAFSFGERVLGLQFHLETTIEGARGLIENCRDGLTPGRWVQSENEILGTPERFRRINQAMSNVLDHLEKLTVLTRIKPQL